MKFRTSRKTGKVHPITESSGRKYKSLKPSKHRTAPRRRKSIEEDLRDCAICGDEGAPWQPQGGVYAHDSCIDEVMSGSKEEEEEEEEKKPKMTPEEIREANAYWDSLYPKTRPLDTVANRGDRIKHSIFNTEAVIVGTVPGGYLVELPKENNQRLKLPFNKVSDWEVFVK